MNKRTTSQIERELRTAQAMLMLHPQNSRSYRAISERVKLLAKELALTVGSLSIGAL